MSFTNFQEAAVLNDLFSVTRYVGLFTAAPSDTGGGTEVSGGSYAREATPASDWATATAGSISNTSAISWTNDPTGAWGEVTHFGIFDAATSGNLLAYGALSGDASSRTIGAGNPVSFQSGQLTITLD
jgi:hypothetical protein